MLERACKMLVDQFIGGAIIDTNSQNSQELVSKTPRNAASLIWAEAKMKYQDINIEEGFEYEIRKKSNNRM